MSIAALALVACSSHSQPANDPSSQTNTTGVAVDVGPASPGDPAGNTSVENGVKATSGSPASPMEGGCPRGAPRLEGVSDGAACIATCRGQDETVPVGSKCVSQYESCVAECNDLF